MGKVVWVIVIIAVVFGILYLNRSFVPQVQEGAREGESSEEGPPPFSLEPLPREDVPPEEGGIGDVAQSGTRHPEIDPRDIPDGFTATQLSPYWGKVTIGGFSAKTGDSQGELSLDSRLAEGEALNITGFWAQSNRRARMFIPQAIAVYNPFATPASGDIILRGGQTVKLYSSSSAIGRAGMRLNRCTGYLEHALDFAPELPLDCPDDITNVSLLGFRGKCQDYARSLGRCEVPDLNHPDLAGDEVCREYLRDFNYSGCFRKHHTDPDFLTNEWWIWTLENFLEADDRHDRLLLFDRQGLLVGEHVY